MDRIALLTSGGDAPGMNAAIRAVVRTAIVRGLDVLGIERGYSGLIRGQTVEMHRKSVSNIIQRGGTILMTSRSERFLTPDGRGEAADILRDNHVDGLVVIGGDGTFQGAMKLEREQGIRTIGVPGTIDNDLYGTDETIGFDTAVNTALEAIDKIRDTAAATGRIFFVEVMGRHAGFIALQVGLSGGAEEVLIPEHDIDLDQTAAELSEGIIRGKTSSIVIVAEGAYEGGVYAVARKVSSCCGVDHRVTVLGHIQRGGAPTARDRVLGSRLGAAAVTGLLENMSGVMAGIADGEVAYTPYKDVCKQKPINMELVNLAAVLST
jgi:6-phosphofructokinase 1